MKRSTAIALGSAIIGIISLIYLAVVYIPVLIVEAKYQATVLLEKTTGETSFRRLIIPQFDLSNPDLQTASIEIPKLYLHEPVIFNVDPANKAVYSAALQEGIAHAQRTGEPGSGQLGYYFAHSSNPEFRKQYNAVFYLLNKLDVGNKVYVWNEGKKYEYAVTKKELTDPDYIDFVTQPYNDETIVLQTCWPPGTTAQRLLVFAEKTN